MTLSTLIKKGGLTKTVTATHATTATQKEDKTLTVAPVATVAVAHTPEPLPVLTPVQEKSILAWLVHIEETNPENITEILNQCRNEPDALRYFLNRSEEVPKTASIPVQITCGDCIHFVRIDHPNLGHCAKGEPEAIAGLWDSDTRYCEKFYAYTIQSSGVLTNTMKDNQ